MNQPSRPPRPLPHVIWPLWVKMYMVLIAAPMIALSLGINLWLIRSRFDGLLTDSPLIAVIMLLGATLLNFLAGAWLFYVAIWRTLNHQPEAPTFAATGHLLLAIPPLVFAIVSFAVDHVYFLDSLYYTLSRDKNSLELYLIIWIAFHVYLGLILSLADNTGYLLLPSHKDDPD